MTGVDLVLSIGVDRAIRKLRAGDTPGAELSLTVALWTAQAIEAKGGS